MSVPVLFPLDETQPYVVPEFVVIKALFVKLKEVELSIVLKIYSPYSNIGR